MQKFKSFITEASIMKPDYVIGHKVIWKGSDFSELNKLGYKKGDVFEIVGAGQKVELVVGKEGSDHEKFLKGPDGKVIHVRGGLGYKSSAFTHFKEGGGIPSGAEWEDLIVYAYNNLNNQDTDPATEEVALKFWDKYSDQATAIAKNFNIGLAAKKLVQTGRGIGSVNLGPIWNEVGAKNKTPKTDIASADFNEKISLKKAGGSQLASAEKKEAIAIVKAALSEMGNEKKFAVGLVQSIEDNMTALMSKESVTVLSQKSKAGDTSDEVLDFQAKDKGNKELSDMLAQYINNNNEANALFSKYIVLEASTGNNKFGSPNSKAAANILGKFDPSGDVTLEPINSIHDPIIKKYASTVRPYVAFKKGGGGSPAYSAMRLGIKEEFQTFKEIVMEELSQVDGLLTEHYLAEGPLDMLKRARGAAVNLGRNIVDKVKNAIKVIIQKISATLKKIANLGRNMFSSLLKFLGLDILFASGIPGEVSL